MSERALPAQCMAEAVSRRRRLGASHAMKNLVELTKDNAFRLVGTAVFSVIVLMSVPARAEGEPDVQAHLLTVKRLYEDLEYELALAQIAQARSLKRTENEDMALLLYEGALLADLSRWEESAAAFKKALVVRPEAQLPVKVSPKVVQHFEKVRQTVKEELAANSPVSAPPPPLPMRDLLQPKDTQEEMTRYSRPWAAWKPWAVLGAGAVVALGGGALHREACKSYVDFDTAIVECDGCIPGLALTDMRVRGDNLKRLAFGAYAVGGAAIITGAVLAYINRPQAYRVNPDEAENPSGVKVAPLINGSEGGIQATFLF